MTLTDLAGEYIGLYWPPVWAFLHERLATITLLAAIALVLYIRRSRERGTL